MEINDLARLIELEAMNIREMIHEHKVKEKTKVQRACVELRQHIQQLSREIEKY